MSSSGAAVLELAAELERERKNTRELQAAGARLGGTIAELEAERVRLLEIIADVSLLSHEGAPAWLRAQTLERVRGVLREARAKGQLRAALELPRAEK